MTQVLNLKTGKYIQYTCKPVQAVIAAYAQSRGDFNTWDYVSRYGHMVKRNGFTVAIGDFAVRKQD